MTKNEWIDQIIHELHSTMGGKRLSGTGPEYREAKFELLYKGYITDHKLSKGWYKLTHLGYEIAESGLKYEEWIDPKRKTKPPSVEVESESPTRSVSATEWIGVVVAVLAVGFIIYVIIQEVSKH